MLACDCIGGVMTETPPGFAGASAISAIMQMDNAMDSGRLKDPIL